MKKTLGILTVLLCATPMIYAQADGNAAIESSDVAMTSNSAVKGYVIASGFCGKNVNYELYDDYTLRIFGKGAMYNYNYIYTPQRMYSDAPWSSWDSKIKSVVIEDGVTRIGADTFCFFSSLTEVNIPNTVTSIGRGAFRDCTALKKIYIPNSVTAIGAYAFWHCGSLAEVNIPDGIETIDEGVFADCDSLAHIDIPNSVTSIGNSAFSECFSLTEIIIPDGVTSIGENAFGWCDNLKYVKIGKGVTVIADFAFFNNYTNKKIEIEIAAETHVTLLDAMVLYYGEYEPNSTSAFGFSINSEDITIRVPDTMLNDYLNSEEWSYYKDQLYGYSSTGIRSVGDGRSATMKADVVYDLQGRRVTEMQPDRIYIVNGKKVVNK